MKKFKSSFYNVLVQVPETGEYILYNSISGGLEVLHEEIGTFLQEVSQSGNAFNRDNHIDVKTFDYLLKNGYLLDANCNEKEQFFELIKNKKDSLRAFQETAEISLTITTTIKCNMNCSYCYEFVKPNKAMKEGSGDDIINYLESMIRNAPVKRFRSLKVAWYGGEPLINTKIIKYLTPKLVLFCEI